eukprot:3914202-Rhodomonas_salina.1
MQINPQSSISNTTHLRPFKVVVLESQTRHSIARLIQPYAAATVKQRVPNTYRTEILVACLCFRCVDNLAFDYAAF